MHNYHDTKGRLPPAAVCGKDGRPLLSWRVLILPCIEAEPLFEQFKLDEPWDSPHNMPLLAKMPLAYAPPKYKAGKIPPYHTVCHVFVGKGAAFEGQQGLKLTEDFPDSTSSTFLVVEAGKPVPWTKPEDLAFEPDGPLPDLCCLFRDGFRATMADASVHYIKKTTTEATLRALITRNGGEVLKEEWW
jgi:hypothetical protein